jgi:CHASE2 domain-containing sensor protein
MRELTFEEINEVAAAYNWADVAAGMTVASAGLAVAAYWTGPMPAVSSFLAAGAVVTSLTAAETERKGRP